MSTTAPLPAFAQTVRDASPETPRRTLVSELITGSASGGTQEGMGLGLRYTDTLHDTSNLIEYRRQSRFNETGQLLALQQTRSLNASQRLTVGANASDSFLFPRLGASAVFEHNWSIPLVGASRIGVSHQRLRGSQTQNALLLEQTGRLPGGLIWQIGRQQGVSSPGSRSFHTHHIAFQYLAADGWRAVLRKQWSQEAVQAVSSSEDRFDFNSQGLRAGVGLQVRRETWLNLFHERYDTPFYERRQWGVGLEQSW